MKNNIDFLLLIFIKYHAESIVVSQAKANRKRGRKSKISMKYLPPIRIVCDAE